MGLKSDNPDQVDQATASEWRNTTLGAVTDLLSGGTPSKSQPDYWGGSIPWVSAKDMKRLQLHETVDKVTTAGLANGTNQVPANTVMILVRGMTLLNDVPICITQRPMTFNQDVKALQPKPGVSEAFLPYLILGNKDRLLGLVDLAGHGTGRLNTDEVKALEIDLPPLPQQRAIAHVLGTLDDKIELNRRMNETLEEMARTLFKSWFVDFDPVRAKAALREHALRASRPDTPHPSPPPQGGRESDSRGKGFEYSPREGSDYSPLEGESARRGALTPSSRWGEDGRHRANRWEEISRGYSKKTLEQARALRQRQTDAEGLLWHYLRGKQLGGFKFRRQQPIGPYIVDFACMPEKLLVELDGGQHAEQSAHDERRDAFLRSKGYRVLRFWNNQVFENCFGVLERVYESLLNPPPRQAPPAATPPQGGSDRTYSPAGSTPSPQTPAPSPREGEGWGGGPPAAPTNDWTPERARAYLDAMAPHIADLFPDRLVPSELGEIPEGWEVKSLGEFSDLNSESWSRTASPREVEYVDLANTKWGVIETTQHFPWKDAPSRAKRVLRSGDTIVGTVRPGNGSYSLVGRDGLTGSTGFAVLRPSHDYFRELIYLAATSPENIEQLAYRADGAAYPAVRPEVIAETEVPIPTSDTNLLGRFSMAVGSIIDKIESIKAEMCFLAAQRDALLPKLVSGESRIAELH